MPKGQPTRTRRSKVEVQEDFEKLAEQEAAAKQERSSKDEHIAQLKARELREAVASVTVESMAQHVSALNVDLSRALSDMSSKLMSEVQRLEQVRAAIALESAELQRVHQIDTAATALDHLVEEYQRQKDRLEAESAAQRAAWAEERQAFAKEQRDAEDALKRDRQREREDFEYKKALERKKAQDQYDEAARLREKHDQERQEQLEKNWNERETALKLREDELTRYKAEVEQFGTRLKEERDRSAADASAATKQAFELQLQLAKKDVEAEKAIDRRRYPTGKKVSEKQLREINIERHEFQGDWNYTICPQLTRPKPN